jgi:1-acyl-sn-glycerol-3-phosphate acyltransferase
VIALRSVIFNIAFYVNLILFLILGAGFFITPRKWSIRALQAWARTSLWLLRMICNIHADVRGLKNIPKGAASAALRKLLARGMEEIAAGRQIVIMPEGTRSAPDAPPDYKSGAAALYGTLGSPCLPFALNSGLFWPRRKFLRLPGTIILEFLPPIPAGLSRKVFQERLQTDIETATARLVAEGRVAVRSKNKSSTLA